MNLLLQDPFSVLKDYPEKLVSTLENPLNTECLQFSPGGDYLALGCSNGAVIVYDMDTNRPINMLGSRSGSHVQAVNSIAWSPCGRYLISTSRDWYIKLWDLAMPEEPFREVVMDSSVWNCSWLDGRRFLAVATVLEEKDAFLVDFNVGNLEDEVKVLPIIPHKAEEENNKGYILVATAYPKQSDIIVTGSSKGWLTFYKIEEEAGNFDFQILSTERIGATNIKHIIISQSGDRLAINCSDRTIRQFSLNVNNYPEDSKGTIVEMEQEHKYQDVINKLQWNFIFFSNNSAEYLVASTHGSSAHELYIWETSTGTLVRVLEGAEEELMDITWNFYNMSIASNGFETGSIYIWSIVIPPKWNALAPDFEEVEENVIYDEKEDEFDQVDINEQQQEITEAEEVPIDLETREQFDVRCNDLSQKYFTIPMDYQHIMFLQSTKMMDGA
ncbi:COMPASS component SWD1 [Nakaseomyces bracarensis]|uniref:COMPASS component SWD1 n=1 Tax=Nakaseomyces bracarensis TaxID=273131 RepID=A0ABR4NS20_9SACH